MSTYLYDAFDYLTIRSYHIMYGFKSECTLYSCLNVKESLAWYRLDIWSLNDCSGTGTLNRLVCKRTLKHLSKLDWALLWVLICAIVDNFLSGQFPDWHFLEDRCPTDIDGHFPNRTIPRLDNSPMETPSTEHFPVKTFPRPDNFPIVTNFHYFAFFSKNLLLK